MTSLKAESWTLWALVMFVAGSRFTARRMILGAFRNYQLDDYLMMLVLCFYTALIVTINFVRHMNSNLLPPGFDVASLTPMEYHERVLGSKLILVVEQCQCATIWGVKGCLIILYLRLTTVRRVNVAIKALACYVAGSYVLMILLYFFCWCRPFTDYWAIPTKPQCDAATNHLITNAVFNLSSDLIMLALAWPMFWRLQLPWQKKAPVLGVFSLGIFVILAAILNKVYSFTDPFGAEWTYWYVRESSTALLVANLPFVWTLWRRAAGFQSTLAATRTKTVNASELPTYASVQDRNGGGDTKVRGARLTEAWLADDDDALTDDSSGDRGGIIRTRSIVTKAHPLSLSDMLIVDDAVATTGATKGPAPTPLTHPALFYGQTPAGPVNTVWSETAASGDHATGTFRMQQVLSSPVSSKAPSIGEDAETTELEPSV